MLMQISSAHGPLECQLAAANALRRLQAEADTQRVVVTVLDAQPGERPGTLRSALLDLDGEGAQALADRWTGTLQWICASPYRLRHPRKNWFIGVTRCADARPLPDGDVRFEAMRARGPGGQHVNKTSSAIRATHVATGLSVRVESERSQHANKRLALQLLQVRLQQESDRHACDARRQRRMQHFALERGNPVRVFYGAAFVPAD
ncbi:peptide chain release factor H [Burkholderia contaminans]|uniref:Peptide chain release factor H n=2 Tax=Burkholderia contaminans TaxID=488447 RepID=A0AAP4VI34_9BURK|nr:MULTISPECIES: peptide chain release factor H [Burkholderia]MBD1415823.1 peptide chain release factor H [Burkholderia contaminans]MBH9667669.1 peptide chain release factor H [Burkholderia contaminans]MBH9675031.1 peptide chain release factor H [Burkholderia contaminans]MBH9704965.1 peptide chain release factor H [Burkholderia contaminans]MBH9722130.1 peptide chain release factor H [Burkholderia contaminans]